MRARFMLAGVFLFGATLPLAKAVAAEDEERVWDGVVGAIKSCDDLIAPEVEVEGTLTFLKPIECQTAKTIHVVGDTLIRSRDLIDTTNVHLIVRHDAKLTLAARAILMQRDEASTQPLLGIFGKVNIDVTGWTPSYVHGSLEDENGLVRVLRGAALDSDHAIHFTESAMVVANKASMLQECGDGEPKPFEKGSSVEAHITKFDPRRAIRGAASTADKQGTSGNTNSLGGNGGGSGGSGGGGGAGGGGGDSTSSTSSTSSSSTSSDAGNLKEKNMKTAAADTSGRANEPIESSAASPTGEDGVLEPTPSTPDTASTNNAKSEPGHDSARGRYTNTDHAAPHRLNRWVSKPRPSLKVGDQLTGTLWSEDGRSAVWLGIDGSLLFGKHVPAPPADGDEAAGGGDGFTVPMRSTALLRPDYKKLRKVLNARQEARDEGRGGGEGDGGKKKARGWWSWGGRSRRQREAAAEDMGKVCLSIDSKGCVKATVDGTTVLSKSGPLKWDWLNRLPWKRPRDGGYQLHVTDGGMEVRLRERTVWGITTNEWLG